MPRSCAWPASWLPPAFLCPDAIRGASKKLRICFRFHRRVFQCEKESSFHSSYRWLLLFLWRSCCTRQPREVLASKRKQPRPMIYCAALGPAQHGRLKGRAESKENFPLGPATTKHSKRRLSPPRKKMVTWLAVSGCWNITARIWTRRRTFLRGNSRWIKFL